MNKKNVVLLKLIQLKIIELKKKNIMAISDDDELLNTFRLSKIDRTFFPNENLPQKQNFFSSNSNGPFTKTIYLFTVISLSSAAAASNSSFIDGFSLFRSICFWILIKIKYFESEEKKVLLLMFFILNLFFIRLTTPKYNCIRECCCCIVFINCQ